MDDIPGRLRCCAGISPPGEMTRLRPGARLLMDAAADEIERLRGALEAAEEYMSARATNNTEPYPLQRARAALKKEG